jgi:L-threonylcarbamoyladenylate synthase
MAVLYKITDSELRDALLAGKIGVLPTDTLYGVVCSAVDRQAVNKLYGLKSRQSKPGTIVAASIDQLVELGLKRRYLTAVSQFWPNPISLVIPTGNQDLQYLDQGLGTIAVRIVDDKNIVGLLNVTGPLLTSSANLPGEAPAVNIAQAQNYFADTVDFYVDGGDLSSRLPSTLIRIVDDAVVVLREGAGKIDPKYKSEE